MNPAPHVEPALHRSAGEASRLDLDECAGGPVDIPHSIQPHGAVLAASTETWLITHASANLGAILGIEARSVLGTPLQDVIGDRAFQSLRSTQSQERWLGHMRASGHGHRILHLTAHWPGHRVCLDIQPIGDELQQLPLVTVLQSVVATFKDVSSAPELAEAAIRGLKAICGYSRVMAYRFGEHGRGEVIGEVHDEHLDPYWASHYSSTDISPQARALYLRERVFSISDCAYQPVPLLVDTARDDAIPLDLTHSDLRGVSQLQRDFMRNAGTVASLSIGLSYGQELWGLLICDHSSPRVASPELRAVAEMIGQVVSLLLRGLDEAMVFAERLERVATLNKVVNLLTGFVALPDALAAAGQELLHLVNASGAVVRLGGVLFCVGSTPDGESIEQAVLLLQSESSGDLLAIDNFVERYPQFATSAADCGGVLLMSLAQGPADLILWYRPDLSPSAAQSGDAASTHAIDAAAASASPRTVFAGSAQTRASHSAPWTKADLALAGDLRSAIAVEVARRAEIDRVWLRHYHDLSDSLEVKVQQHSRDLEIETEERQKVEATLQQSQKMEAIGQLTGGVAHDFNNILAAILSNLDLAHANAPGKSVERFLRNAQHAAERGAKLTDHLLSFARKQPLRREVRDLNALCRGFESLIARSVGPSIAVTLHLDGSLWTVEADTVQFEMALLNLAVNARDAMPDGGKLVISTGNIGAGSAGLPGDLLPGSYVWVTVKDSGTGMSPEIAARAFEPFYTTKEIGRGTGLGLSQVYGFSKQLGGTATVASAPGDGTTVSLWLPRCSGRPAGVARPTAAAPAPPAPRGRGHRLLLIDDDQDVLEATFETLLALGFDVVSAKSGRDGLSLLKTDATIDIAVTDFAMPEMNGIEFIRTARLSRPELHCLLVTGYADVSGLTDTRNQDIAVLRKPYRMKDLAASINNLSVDGWDGHTALQ